MGASINSITTKTKDATKQKIKKKKETQRAVPTRHTLVDPLTYSLHATLPYRARNDSSYVSHHAQRHIIMTSTYHENSAKV